MPSGGRQVLFGDLCKDCRVPLDKLNCVYKAHRLIPWCKICWPIHHNSTPSRSKSARQAQYINWKFGISIEEYNAKLEKQSGGCAICKQSCSTGRRLAIDHDHETNQFRDLLCYRCNAVLGLLHEDEDLIWNMLEYLKRHSKSQVA